MFQRSDISRPTIDRAEMAKLLRHAFGEAGEYVAAVWERQAETYFDGQLRPVPILLVRTMPHGWDGLTTGGKGGVASIQIREALLHDKPRLRAVLLHQQLHQYLCEQGDSPNHAGNGWCREVVRLSEQLGECVWAAPSKPRKRREADGTRRSVRRQAPPPRGMENVRTLTHAELATWPMSIGLYPPDDL